MSRPHPIHQPVSRLALQNATLLLFVLAVVIWTGPVQCQEQQQPEESRIADSSLKVIRVRKCCPEGDVAYWAGPELRVQCLGRPSIDIRQGQLAPDWTGNFTEFTEEGMRIAEKKPDFVTEYGLPNCAIPTALYPDLNGEGEDFAIFTNGDFMRFTGHSVRQGMYCVDRFVTSPTDLDSTMRGSLVCDESLWIPPLVESAAFDGSATFSKCCKEHQVFDPDDERCVDYHGPISIRAFPVHDSRDGQVLDVTSATMRFDVLSTFRNDCKTIVPSLQSHDGSQHPFHMLETGHLYFPYGRTAGQPSARASYSDSNGTASAPKTMSLLYPSEVYCLDFKRPATTDDDGEGHQDAAVALVCEPTEEARLAAQVAKVRALKTKFREASCESRRGPGQQQPAAACVLKCCAQGRLLAMSPENVAVCEPASGDHERWRPTFHDDDLNPVELEPWKYKVLDAFQPACKNGHIGTLPQIPAFDPEQSVFLLTDGRVHSTKYGQRFSGPEYCMDLFRPPTLIDGNNDPQAVEITLLCFPEQPEEEPIFYVYGVCLLVSCIFLVLTLVLSLLLPDSNRLSTWTMLSFVSSLLLASALLSMMQLFQTHLVEGLCMAFAFVTYYSFLAAFLWLNVMSFDIWYTVSYSPHEGKPELWNELFELHDAHAPVDGKSVTHSYNQLQDLNDEQTPIQKRNLPSIRTHMWLRYLKRCCYAFGVPSALTTLALVFQFAPGIPKSHFTQPVNPENRCWFRNDWTIGLFFYGPIALILVANMVFFILTARFLIVHRKTTQNLNMRQSTRKRFGLYARLFVVMGVSWMTEVISWKAGPAQYWYVTDVVNALTGILVFIVFICRRQTLRELRRVHPFFEFVLSCCGGQCWRDGGAISGNNKGGGGSSSAGVGGHHDRRRAAVDSAGGKSCSYPSSSSTTNDDCGGKRKFSVSMAGATQDSILDGDSEHPPIGMGTFSSAPGKK